MEKFFVPNEILRVFRQHYPDVDIADVEWSWEVPGKIYEAEFDENDQEVEVEITVTGHWLLTERTIAIASLPKAVQEAIAHDFADHALERATHIKYSNGDIAYEVALKSAKSGESFEAIYRGDGWQVVVGEDL